MRSFCANGYDGASVDTLCRVTGRSRASLYHDYGGKEGLFLAAIGHDAETRIARVVSSLGPDGTMAEDLAAFFEAVVELATSEPDALGCLVSCVLTDAAGSNEDFRDELGRRMQVLEERIAHRLALAGWPEDVQVPAGTAAGPAAVAAHGIMVRARCHIPRDSMPGLHAKSVAADQSNILLNVRRRAMPTAPSTPDRAFVSKDHGIVSRWNVTRRPARRPVQRGQAKHGRTRIGKKGPTLKKNVLLAVVVVAVLALLFALRGQSLDLESLRVLIERLRAWQAENALTLIAAFFAGYVVVTALSLPFAVWMTLAAGALFGFWQGLLIVSFASSLGATVAFLASRYLLRDWVRDRLGARAAAIDDGMRRDGPFFLFSLRLIPVIPFFAVNLLMGLTPIRALTFYLVSQAGMLAGTAGYVNAGTQLAQLDSLSGIVSPALLASFALLGLFPWIARMVLNLLKRRKVYARWTRPRSFDRNLIVIGGGAAGLVSAYIAAATKAKVTLVEGHKMGGDCLNYGCVPSKALIKSAKLAHQMRKAGHYGLTDTQPQIPFSRVMARVHKVIAEIEPHDSVERYTGLGVEVLQGYARLIDPWTVEIALNDGGVQRLTTRAIIIATGAAPFVPPLPGIADVGYLTSDTLWDRLKDRDDAPRRLVVLGGGPIGTELAQSFARLGSDVTQIEMAPRIMIREDEEVSALVRVSLESDGVTVLTGHKALSCGVTDGEKWIEVEHDGQMRRIAFDEMIAAVGRAPRLTGFGLEELGIRIGRVVETNEYLETLYPNILAAGDVAGPYQFTHTAGHQAWFAAVNALFGDIKRFKADYRVIPWATFTDPEVARVGLSEAEAREKGIPVEVTRYGIDDLDRAIADGAAHGFVKVLTVPGKDRILGVTIVGEHAGDLIAEFVLAMKHGLGLGKILGTIHIYPTLAEANKYAAGEWRRAHVNPRLLALVARYHSWRRG